MRTLTLLVPSPAEPPRLDRFLAVNVLGLSRKQAKGLIDAGQVRVGGRTVRKASTPIQPGSQVELDYRPSMLAAPQPIGAGRVLERGPAWFAINKPHGVPSHRPDQDLPGVAELLEGIEAAEGAAPVHRLDRETSGVLILATSSEARAALSALFATRAVEKAYRAIVHPAPEGEGGVLEGPDDMVSRWSLLRRSRDGSRAELAVFPEQGRTHQIRIQLAAAGCAVVGDLEHGTPVPGGSPRMALHCERLAWQDQTVLAPMPGGWEEILQGDVPPTQAPRSTERRQPEGPSQHRSLRVSAATARILRSGHPWVIRDGDTGDLGLFEAGDLAELVDPRGKWVATAIVDPSSSVCARVVSTESREALGSTTWTERALAAADRRRRFVARDDTDAYRLVHGEADGLPGLAVDRWGDVLVATRTTAAAAAYRATYPDLLEACGATALWEQDHFEDLRAGGARPEGAARQGRWVIGTREDTRWTVTESGLRYFVEPLAGLTTGLYSDQRENRGRLRRLIEDEPSAGREIANLFSHTAAFSVACAAAGAERVHSIDLARRYSEWASQNLVLNGLDPSQHPVVMADAMEWLRSAEGLSGVIIDPPAHARRKKGSGMDWNARRDYRALVAAAAGALGTSGWLLCCVNLKGLKRDWLKREVEAGLRKAGRSAAERPSPAAPGPDHPHRKSFPEGRAFEGVLVRISE